MRDITYDNITDVVLKAYSGTENKRVRELVGSLIKHMHDYVREVDLTPQEWEETMNFLLRAAKASSDERNEFILLSDLLGVSALVDLQEAAKDPAATITTVLGPFYLPGTPEVPYGANLIGDNDGERILVRGQIKNTAGQPVPNARIEVWQNANNGLYKVQDPEAPEHNLRATLHCDDQGRYCFATIAPIAYEVPDDAAGGELIHAAGRHCWRPAHVHMMITADGYKRHITQVFNEDDPYIDGDAVFGVRAPLAISWQRKPSNEDVAQHPDIEQPFNVVEADFVLAKAG
ncbi:MAG: dioxygenase [Alphaproteobacteria bacterium]